MTIPTEVEYYYDDGGYYAYVLLNCPEPKYVEIRNQLNANGIRCLHYGKSFRPASNGKQYQWFVRVLDVVQKCKPEPERIERFFEEVVGVYSERKYIRILQEEKNRLQEEVQAARQRIEEAEKERERVLSEVSEYAALAGEYDEENQSLKQRLQERDNQMVILQAQLEQAQERLAEVQREIEKQQSMVDREPYESISVELTRVISCLLPDIEFLSGSIDVLVSELKDYKPALRLLHRLHCQPESIKAESFESASAGWRRLRFGGNGRIYFKRESGKCKVLVSFKKYQKRDERYLKKVV